MKKYPTIASLDDAPAEIAAEIKGATGSDWPDGDLIQGLGGEVCVVERFEDLAEVQGTGDYNTNIYLSVLEGVPGWDAAHYLPSGQWAMLFLATNNAGGASFFIPRSLADQVPNIKASIEASNPNGTYHLSTRAKLIAITRISPVSSAPVTRMVPLEDADYLAIVNGSDGPAHLTSGEREFLRTGASEEERGLLGGTLIAPLN